MDVDGVIRCGLCGRRTPRWQLSKHHVLPKSRGGRRSELLCKTCHGHIHALFSVKELERSYRTLDALRAASPLQGYLRWIRKQKPTRQFRRRR
ncbi:MAG: HNH endonuclease [Phycisphaerales bacterium]|nr:MAG: HNH endonuclease [Phycisphaerales bacterium]